MLHQNEVDFSRMNETNRLTYQILAADLGKEYVAALKIQMRRQGVSFVISA